MLDLTNNEITNDEFNNLFKLIDINNDERIEYDEFICIFKQSKDFNEDLVVE